MKNSQIQYSTSRAYERLHFLLKAGIKIVAFVAIKLNDDTFSQDYSTLKLIQYNDDDGSFDLGVATVFESDITPADFIRLCRKYNLRFIDV